MTNTLSEGCCKTKEIAARSHPYNFITAVSIDSYTKCLVYMNDKRIRPYYIRFLIHTILPYYIGKVPVPH